MLSKKSHNMHFFWSAVRLDPCHHPTRYLSSQCDNGISFMVGYHDHVSTASSQRDCMSHSTLSHYNLANMCGWRSSSHSSPLSETRHVSGNSWLKNIPSKFMSDITCRFFCAFFVPCNRGLKLSEVVCSNRTWVQTTMPTAAAGDCQEVICKATHPGYLCESHGPRRGWQWMRNSRETHQWWPGSQIFSSFSWLQTRVFQTEHLFWPVFQVHFCCYVKPFGMLKKSQGTSAAKTWKLALVACQRKHFRVFCMIFRHFYFR